MKKIAALIIVSGIVLAANSQKVSGKLLFQQGQQLDVTTTINSKIETEAMGQVMVTTTGGTITDFYKITNATTDNFTLHHENKRINLKAEAMGQVIAMDTDNEKDMSKEEMQPLKKLKEQKYDMVIDPSGKVMMIKAIGEETANAAMDNPMIKDLLSTTRVPAKDGTSFFKILPDSEVGVGDKWSDSLITENAKTYNNYEITAISDATIEIKLTSSGNNTSKAEIMGNETLIVNNITGEGTITLNRNTGVLINKTIENKTTGTIELTAMGMKLPSSSKSTITINVTPAAQ
jgi:hypothetical protein